MAKFLRLSNGVPRSFNETSSTSIYDQSLTVVASSPGVGEIVGPITTGTPVTLPASQTYTSEELEVYLNGTRIDDVLDYNYVSSPPRTQVSFTFDIVVGDVIRFRIDRAP